MSGVTLDLGILLNGIIVVGIGITLRVLHKMYGDIQTLKAVLGINGNPGAGLVHEVQKLREAKHEHANAITGLRFDVDEVKDRLRETP